MPDSKAVLRASNHCFGVISWSKPGIHSYTSNLLTELWVLEKSIQLLQAWSNYQYFLTLLVTSENVKLLRGYLLGHKFDPWWFYTCFNHSKHLIDARAVEMKTFSLEYFEDVYVRKCFHGKSDVARYRSIFTLKSLLEGCDLIYQIFLRIYVGRSNVGDRSKHFLEDFIVESIERGRFLGLSIFHWYY